ncbi:MAG: protein kinase [Planctomycetota bacterium]|nr:protein kinase [Planctomycetota bacterium]
MPTVTCPNQECEKSYQVSEESLGGRARCKACGSVIELKWSGGESDAWPTPGRSSGSTPAETSQPVDTNAAAPKTPGQSQIPETLGRFQIKSLLGAGAFGTVYRAYDPVLEREVALKVPQASMVGNEEAAARFLREAKAAAQLTHPNIVPVFDAGSDGAHIFIASKFIEGQTLDAALDEGRIDHQQAAAILRQLADALAYAHNQGVIHRDIKPSNIMLDQQGQPHVMDFGLARLSDEQQKLTLDGSLLGTPAYMSPEQAGEPGLEVGPASDQYSLGVVLYELLCHQKPFSGPLASLIYQIRKEEPPAPRTIRSAIPRDLEIICLKAMAKESDKRYVNCHEFAEDLQRWLQDQPILARRASVAERLQRWCRRNPVSAALCALSLSLLIAVAITAGAGYFATRAALVKADSERDKAKTAESEAMAALHASERSRYFTQIALADREWQTANTAEAEKLLHEAPPEYRNLEWYYLQHLCRPNVVTIEGHAGRSVFGVAFSPDGKHVATAGEDGTAVIWNSETGELQRTLSGHVGTVWSVAYSHDGTLIATAGHDKTVRLWNSSTGESLKVMNGHRATVTAVAFNPNSTQVVSVAGNWPPRPPGEVLIWDVSSGMISKELTRQIPAAWRVAWSPDGALIAVSRGVQRQSAVDIWSTKTGRTLKTLPQPLRATEVAFNHDSSSLACANISGTVEVWNVSNWSRRFEYNGHGSGIEGVSFSPDGRYLAATTERMTVRMIDVNTGLEVKAFKGHASSAHAVAFCPDGERLVSTDRSGTAKIWKVQTQYESRTLDDAGADQLSVAYSPTGGLLATGGRNGIVTIRDSSTGEVIRVLEGQGGEVRGLAFDPAGKRLVSGASDRSVRIWDVATGTQQHKLTGHNDGIWAVTFSPDGRTVASAGFVNDRTIRTWDAETGKPLKTLKGHTSIVYDVVYTPDGKQIVSAGNDKTVRLWDAETGELLRTIAVHVAPVNGVACSPDGKLIAAAIGDNSPGGQDSLVVLYDATSGVRLRVLMGHVGSVREVAFNADGTRLISASFGAVRIWEPTDGRTVLTWRANHRDLMSDICIRPDGQQLATAGGDVKLWDAPIVTDE